MDKDVKEMTREELEMEVAYLRSKYIWGLQPEDFVAAVADDENKQFKKAVIYSEEEFSDEELRNKLRENQIGSFFIGEWAEIVDYWAKDGFSEEDWNIVATLSHRANKQKTFQEENWKEAPKDLGKHLAFGPEERRALMAKGSAMYPGKNLDGEDILVQVDETGIEVKTFQENGWMRVDYYNQNGYHEGQTFQGKWK